MNSLPKIFMSSLALVFALLLCATDVMAQPGGGRGGRQGRGGDRGGGDIMSRLLQNETVQKELELSQEQIDLLGELGQGRRGGGGDRDSIREQLEGLSDEERAEKIQELRDSRAKEQEEEMNDILLPQQFDRLKQISAQMSAQGGARSLLSGSLSSELKVTDEQKEKIRAKAEELQEEFDKKMAKAREEMQEKLLALLTPEQRDEYEAMMGEKFTIERTQRGGRGGDRGGAGGDRGGRGGAGGDRGGRGGDRGGRGGDRGGRGGDDA